MDSGESDNSNSTSNSSASTSDISELASEIAREISEKNDLDKFRHSPSQKAPSLNMTDDAPKIVQQEYEKLINLKNQPHTQNDGSGVRIKGPHMLNPKNKNRKPKKK